MEPTHAECAFKFWLLLEEFQLKLWELFENEFIELSQQPDTLSEPQYHDIG
jgi:hypothetical protein